MEKWQVVAAAIERCQETSGQVYGPGEPVSETNFKGETIRIWERMRRLCSVRWHYIVGRIAGGKPEVALRGSECWLRLETPIREGKPSGAPRFPEGAEVEGRGQKRPLSRYVGQAAQQESPRPLLLLDDPEDRLHQLFSQLVRFFGCVA